MSARPECAAGMVTGAAHDSLVFRPIRVCFGENTTINADIGSEGIRLASDEVAGFAKAFESGRLTLCEGIFTATQHEVKATISQILFSKPKVWREGLCRMPLAFARQRSVSMRRNSGERT